ncbi:MAG: hypothetical protein WC492_01485 [Candidatus Micrarchaeia archaeon]
MSKYTAALAVILGFAGLALAFGGLGYFGDFGYNSNSVSIEVKAQFLQAMFEGNWDVVSALHKQYGLGGKRFDSMTQEEFEKMHTQQIKTFDLEGQIHDAITAKDYQTAVNLQEQLATLVKENIPAPLNDENQTRKMRGKRNFAPEALNKTIGGMSKFGCEMNDGFDCQHINKASNASADFNCALPEFDGEMPKSGREMGNGCNCRHANETTSISS